MNRSLLLFLHILVRQILFLLFSSLLVINNPCTVFSLFISSTTFDLISVSATNDDEESALAGATDVGELISFASFDLPDDPFAASQTQVQSNNVSMGSEEIRVN